MVVKNNNRSLTFSSLYLSRAIYIPHYCKFLFQEFFRFVLNPPRLADMADPIQKAHLEQVSLNFASQTIK